MRMSTQRDHRPCLNLVWCGMLSSMPFLLEYGTDHGAGWFAVAGTNSRDAMAKAVEALRGLECSHAVLRQTTYPHAVVGLGPVVAAFTRGEGWTVQGVWPGL